MVKPKTYYELYCDRCRKQLTDGDVTAYNSESDLMFVAEESEWKTIDGKHYCPDCYEVDEETDEYVPKKGVEK